MVPPINQKFRINHFQFTTINRSESILRIEGSTVDILAIVDKYNTKNKQQMSQDPSHSQTYLNMNRNFRLLCVHFAKWYGLKSKLRNGTICCTRKFNTWHQSQKTHIYRCKYTQLQNMTKLTFSSSEKSEIDVVKV